MLERAHVVQPVGQLHQQDTHILGHGEQQLAQVLGLGCFLGDQVELGDLGQAIDQRGDFGTELLLDLLVGGRGILHRVMKQGRGNGGVSRASSR